MIDQPKLCVGDVVRVRMHHYEYGGKFYFFQDMLGRLIRQPQQGFWIVTLFGMGNIEELLTEGMEYGGWWNDGSNPRHRTSIDNLKLFARRGGPDDVYPDPLPR